MKNYLVISNIKSFKEIYPLLGPLGTTKGRTIPTMPHKTVITINGTADAPIFAWF